MRYWRVCCQNAKAVMHMRHLPMRLKKDNSIALCRSGRISSSDTVLLKIMYPYIMTINRSYESWLCEVSSQAAQSIQAYFMQILHAARSNKRDRQDLSRRVSWLRVRPRKVNGQGDGVSRIGGSGGAQVIWLSEATWRLGACPVRAGLRLRWLCDRRRERLSGTPFLRRPLTVLFSYDRGVGSI